MEASLSPTMNQDAAEDLKPPAKKRKGVEKRVVRVKIGAEFGKEKSEGPPYDSWSWRKYGQKPIKGSPHPRGYYRCSTSKGCSAKKQVERCKTDPSVLIITYTCSHNHPEAHGTGPRNPKQGKLQEKDPQEQVSSQDQEEARDRDPNMPGVEAEDEFNYSHDFQVGEIFTAMTQLDNSSNNGNNGGGNNEVAPATKLSGVEEEEGGEEYFDFFDELEELYPTGLSIFSYGLRQEGHHQLVR